MPDSNASSSNKSSPSPSSADKDAQDEAGKGPEARAAGADASSIDTAESVQADPREAVRDAEQKARKRDEKAGKSEAGKVTLNKAPDQIIKKIQKVFVAPRSYDERVTQLSKKISFQRIYLVYGPKNSGRFTCALELGLDLYRQLYKKDNKFPAIQFHVNTSTNSISPLDFAQPNFDEDTVYILENVFEGGFSYQLLSEEHLAPVDRALNDAKALLVLTTTDKDFDLDQTKLDKIKVDDWDSSKKDLSKVLTNHLNYYDELGQKEISPEVIAVTKKEAETCKLYSKFSIPIQIDQFCYQLSNVASLSDEKALIEEIKKLADRIVQKDRNTVRLWFNQLTLNQKLYAMLVALCPNLERQWLYDIYAGAVQSLRDQGLSLHDPREFGLDDMLAAIRAQARIDETVEFSSDAVEQEVWRQIDNYHYMLWSLVDNFLRSIEIYKDPMYWEVRRILGETIGVIGLAYSRKLQLILEQLARSEYSGVASTPGYALVAICRISVDYHEGKHLAFIAELIESWVKSADPNLMWAAGAAIWRIYNALNQLVQSPKTSYTEATKKIITETQEKICKALTYFADNFNHFSETQKQQRQEWAIDNARAILYAISQIAVNDPEQVIGLLLKWLQEYETNQCLLAQEAILQLFEANTNPKSLTEQRQGPLLKLIEPLLASAEEGVYAIDELVDQAVLTLLSWMNHSGWHNRIQTALLQAANRASDEGRARLRRCLLRHWTDSDNENARRIAHRLITRTQVMQGMPVALSSTLGGIIALDAFAPALEHEMAAQVGHELYYRLDGLTSAAVAHLGQARPVLEAGKPEILPPTRETLRARFSLPRLLQPLLDRWSLRELHFVLTLSWKRIIDLDDTVLEIKSDSGSTSPPTPDPIIIAAAGQEAASVPRRFTMIQRDSTLSESDWVDQLESAVIKQLARSLAWRCQYNPQLLRPSAETDIEALAESLEKWVDRLDEADWPAVESDPACRIADALLRWTIIDLARAVNQLTAWLQDDVQKDSLRRLIGIACCKMLLRIWAEYAAPPPLSSHAVILKLAPLLGAHGDWSAIEALLTTIRHWLGDNSWAKHCHDSDGGFNNLTEMLDALRRQDHLKLRDALRDWKQPLMGEKVAPEAVIRLAERLEARLALGSPDNIPTLASGERYGVIIWASSPQPETTRLVGKLWKLIRADKDSALRWLLYRAGQINPIAVDKDFSADALNDSDLRPAVPLLAPLLESLPREHVGIVLLLAERDILDRADWIADWKNRFKLYSRNEKAIWASDFQPIPYQPDGDLKHVAQHILEAVDKEFLLIH